ncbi:MAG: hypothetical protein ACK4ME_10740 [Fimbriimonadales bacterium]
MKQPNGDAYPSALNFVEYEYHPGTGAVALTVLIQLPYLPSPLMKNRLRPVPQVVDGCPLDPANLIVVLFDSHESSAILRIAREGEKYLMRYDSSRTQIVVRMRGVAKEPFDGLPRGVEMFGTYKIGTSEELLSTLSASKSRLRSLSCSSVKKSLLRFLAFGSE